MKNDTNKVLFIGDVNVDLVFGGLQYPLQEDKEVMAETFFRTMGSSAAITAVAYSCLGGQADLCGLVGNDENGAYMLDSLDKLGVGRSLVKIDNSIPTGVTVNLIHGRTRSQVTFPGTISRFTGPPLSTDFSEYRHAHFSGIYQQEAFLPNIVSTMQHFKKLGISISVDTQWDVTENWDHLDEIYSMLDYLIINEEEALSISRATNIDSALSYFAGQVSCTLIKLGNKGVCFYENGEVKNVPAYPAEVVDTTGAGDAFAGGFLYALYEGKMDFYKALHYASAVAARNCEFAGGVGAKSTDFDIQKKLLEGNIV